MWSWVLVSGAALVLALLHAIISQAPEPFADWRNLVMLALTVGITLRWLASRTWVSGVLIDLAIGYTAVATISLVTWLLGGGITVFGQATPIFYWPTLFMVLFSSLVLTSSWLSGLAQVGRGRSTLIWVGAVVSTLVIALSFRRSFWLAWIVGMTVLGVNSFRARSLKLATRRSLPSPPRSQSRHRCLPTAPTL